MKLLADSHAACRVSQVYLDGVYESKEIEFDAPAPFNDNEAIKVINGIVKTGDISKGTKPNQYTQSPPR